jgi:hypothetical protein
MVIPLISNDHQALRGHRRGLDALKNREVMIYGCKTKQRFQKPYRFCIEKSDCTLMKPRSKGLQGIETETSGQNFPDGTKSASPMPNDRTFLKT